MLCLHLKKRQTKVKLLLFDCALKKKNLELKPWQGVSKFEIILYTYWNIHTYTKKLSLFPQFIYLKFQTLIKCIGMWQIFMTVVLKMLCTTGSSMWKQSMRPKRCASLLVVCSGSSYCNYDSDYITWMSIFPSKLILINWFIYLIFIKSFMVRDLTWVLNMFMTRHISRHARHFMGTSPHG